MKAIRTIITDDHAIVRAGIRLLLTAQLDIEVVGEAATGDECIALATQLQPDVVVMDIAMPGLDGISATRQLTRICPGIQIVGLTMHENERYFFELLQAGAIGYILKGGIPEHLVEAVRSAAKGQAYLHPSVARLLVEDYRRRPTTQPGMEGLTEREIEVLQCIADGQTGRAVGQQLNISAHTVERHRANLMSKLGLRSKADLIKYAIRRGLIGTVPTTDDET